MEAKFKLGDIVIKNGEATMITKMEIIADQITYITDRGDYLIDTLLTLEENSNRNILIYKADSKKLKAVA